MAPESMTEDMTFTEIVGEHEVACDFGGMGDVSCPGDAAKWIMHATPHGCGVYIRLACDYCKTVRMESDDAGVTCAKCDHFTAPARAAYFLIEALNKGPQ